MPHIPIDGLAHLVTLVHTARAKLHTALRLGQLRHISDIVRQYGTEWRNKKGKDNSQAVSQYCATVCGHLLFNTLDVYSWILWTFTLEYCGHLLTSTGAITPQWCGHLPSSNTDIYSTELTWTDITYIYLPSTEYLKYPCISPTLNVFANTAARGRCTIPCI